MTASLTQIEHTESSSSVSLRPVDPSDLSTEEWFRVAELLKMVYKPRPDMDLLTTIKEIKTGDAFLFVLTNDDLEVDGIIVTKTLIYKTGYSVFLIQCAAVDGPRMNAKSWKTIISQLEEIGKILGSDAVRVIGRKGWGKSILSDYTEVSRTYDKIIAEVH